MKTIVFIGSQKSGSSRVAIKAAEELGFYTVLLTDKIKFIRNRTEFRDAHLMLHCNLGDIALLKDIIRGLVLRALDIIGIVSFVDVHCHTACVLGEEFGINHFSTEAISDMSNKIMSRQLLNKTQYIPSFKIIPPGSTILEIEVLNKFPAILKSPNSCGSKDVLKVNTYDDLINGIKKLSNVYVDEPILLEEFLNGTQYLIETIVYKGKVNIIAVFEQEITFGERFIVTGYSLMLDYSAGFYEKLKVAVEEIIKIHNMTMGACHLEMRFVKKQWKLIETNPRISGGAMNQLIETGLGINLVKETIKMAIGKEPEVVPKFRKNVFAQYVTASKFGVLKRVIGKNKAVKCPGVECVYVKPRKGARIMPPVSMGKRYAYVIATGESAEEAKENSKLAASKIQFLLMQDGEV